MALERVALGSSRCRAPRWGRRAGDHRGGRSPRPRLRAGGDTPSVRGPQPDGSGTRTATAERRGAGDSPGRGGSRERSPRGAPGTAKLSPPPEVRGAEAAMRGSVRGVPRRSQLREAAGEGAPESRPPRSPHPYPGPGAARTHLAVELADRHDPRGPGRARTPWPAGDPRSCPGGGGSRLLAAPAALSPRPARLAPSSRAAREFLGSFLSSPTCPAGFLEAPRPACSRPARPLLQRRRRRSGGRAGGAGGRGRGRAAPLPAQVWEAAREEEGGRAS